MKIVFRSSSVNKAYTVNYQVQNVQPGGTTRNGIQNLNILVVTPRPGYIIEASDFSHGLLPKNIASVSFSNSNSNIDYSNQVRVHIALDLDFTVIGVKNLIFDIPISGEGKLPANKMELTVSVNEGENMVKNTFLGTSVVASPPTLVNGVLSTKYSLEAKKGSRILIFQKEYKAFEGFYFAAMPSYKLNAIQRSRYDIKVFNTYGSNKMLLARKISVYYNFPTENIKSKDYLELSAFAAKKIVRKIDAEYSSSLKPTIFSVKTVGVTGPRGGIIPIEVRGTPGTPFSVAIQNDAKQIYDINTGKFEDGGRFLTGVIPSYGDGRSVGVYTTQIKVPSIYANNTDANAANYVADVNKAPSIETRLVVEKEVATNVKAYRDLTNGDKGSVVTTTQKSVTELDFFPDYNYSPNGTDGSSPVVSFAHIKSKFSKLNSDNFQSIATTELTDGSTASSATVRILGNTKENHGFLYNFEYVLEPTGGTYGTNGFIRIIRQPRFVLFDEKQVKETSFKPWMCDPDGGMVCSDANKKDFSLKQGFEEQINNDFFASAAGKDEETNFGAKYRIGAEITGVGKKIESTGAAEGDSVEYTYYKRVIVRGSISGIILPTEKLQLQLKLQNFLTLKNIS